MHRLYSRRRTLALFAVSAAALAAAMAPAAAQTDFSGQRIEMIVPHGEGGGADTYARYMAQALAPHLPGEPSIIIRNVPGGATLIGVKYFEENAEPDGLMIMTVSTTTLITYSLTPDAPGVDFDPSTWIPVMSSPLGSVVYFHSSAEVETVADIKALGDKPLPIGLQSPTGSDMRTLLSLHMLGINAEPIFGMEGGDAHLAFERGELLINSDTAAAYMQMAQPLVDAGTAVPLFTFGYLNEAGELERDPTFPDLPHFGEVYEEIHGEPPSGPDYEAWLSLFNSGVMSSKTILLPEGTPQEIVDTYRAAAAEMASDPAFKEAAASQIGIYPQSIGDQAKTLLDAAVTLTPEAREWLAEWLKAEYDVTL